VEVFFMLDARGIDLGHAKDLGHSLLGFVPLGAEFG
jgi:hypothetical protein